MAPSNGLTESIGSKEALPPAPFPHHSHTAFSVPSDQCFINTADHQQLIFVSSAIGVDGFGKIVQHIKS
jgi:hypothetical protein